LRRQHWCFPQHLSFHLPLLLLLLGLLGLLLLLLLLLGLCRRNLAHLQRLLHCKPTLLLLLLLLLLQQLLRLHPLCHDPFRLSS
jgi:hypothetical protein